MMLYDDTTAGQTYELYGPKNYSMAEIAELVDREIFKKRKQINIPKAILKPVAGLLNRVLWWPMMSADEVEREFHDQQIDELAKTFKDLNIEPAEISKFTYHYLVSSPDQPRESPFSRRLTLSAARIPEFCFLRPSAGNGEGEEGGEEILACIG